MNISQHNVLEVTLSTTKKKVDTWINAIKQGTIFGELNGEARTIYILGRKNMNRGIQGDVVAVEILPKDQWKRNTSLAVEEEEDEEKLYGEDSLDVKMKDANDIGEDQEGEPTAKVVGVIRKKWRP